VERRCPPGKRRPAVPEYLVEAAFGSVVKGFYVVADSGDLAGTEVRRKYPNATVERIVTVTTGHDEAGRPRIDPEAGRP